MRLPENLSRQIHGPESALLTQRAHVHLEAVYRLGRLNSLPGTGLTDEVGPFTLGRRVEWKIGGLIDQFLDHIHRIESRAKGRSGGLRCRLWNHLSSI